MPAKTKTMNQIRMMLQLHAEKQGIRTMARMLQISRNTVRSYLERFRASGFSVETLLALDDQALAQVCDWSSGPPPDERYSLLQEQLADYANNLEKQGVTRQLLWEEYRTKYPDGYSYTQFCHYLLLYLGQRNVTAMFRQTAGDRLQVDYAGKTLMISDAQTGLQTPVPVFVAVLPFSGLLWCQALPDMTGEHFAHALGGALRYLGGVPRCILYDNGKQVVQKANRYEPVFQELTEQLSVHYATTFMATRARKPRDKPHVEAGVRIVYQRIYARMRDEVFFSLEALNARIGELVDALNNRTMTGKGYSRRAVFDRKERTLLRPLPPSPFVVRYHVQATVQRNYHLMLGQDKHLYSVPYSLVGQRLTMQYDHHSVEIYAGSKRVAVHKRSRHPYGYTTERQHMPVNHQVVQTIKGWDKAYFQQWADQLGPHTRRAIDQVLSRPQFIEQSYRSCLGILRLKDRYTAQRLEQACQMAASRNAACYQRIEAILRNGTDQRDEKSELFRTPEHGNIRGSQHYANLFPTEPLTITNPTTP